MSKETGSELLHAELLSDLGKIRQEIKTLTGDWNKAATTAQAEIDSKVDLLSANKQVEFRHFVKAEKASIQAAIHESLANAIQAITKLAKSHDAAAQRESRQWWRYAIAAGIFAMVGGAIGQIGINELYYKAQAQQAAFGRAAMSVWSELPKDVKGQIEAAYH